ncbi:MULTISPECIES: helix-turn-helix transcriptional regulator [unclassified Paenibacillus]|uniref:helix-turn-helix domain-containing protein n=1 Tax=unclassified Paenibacillus TaxID=185978 RepID=UPI001AE55654|nr:MULTISPECIES: helix-turn-helix transcriptional regulator [unclassified Paenibacillus]MBP1153939.1 transcriptional regulator with XRE-family HTH domain [Paenibacillus sp. PvP091]MBP1170676.1 transcriptional regulator with XRE-family HTH domain [Paenibacillus sp. PvR098]MBP2441704.1 transcriptional regulator with XRE-family HTH domain [Paenibacillus sp. PvP052]
MVDDKKQSNSAISIANEESNSGGGYAIADSFGILIRHYRMKVKDLSLKQLEEMSQVSSSYINRLERGEKTSPSLPVVFSLAESLEIPYSVLMATIFQKAEEHGQPSISDVLIQSNFVLNDQQLSKEARSILIRINEFLVDCKWNAETKVKELYMLSEMLDEFKAAI